VTLIRKTALIVALFTVANIAFGYAIKRNWIDSAFEDFEKRAANRRLQQIAEAIEREFEDVGAMVYEFSNWDATYDYVVSGDPAYHDENLTLDVLEHSDFDWITFLNTSGRVVSGPIYDIPARQLITAPEIPQDQWDPSHPLLTGSVEEDPTAGLLVTRDGPMVVASRHVLTSRGTGPARGRVILGRRLDAELMRELGEVVGEELHLWLATDSELPETARTALLLRNGDPRKEAINLETDELEIFRQFDDHGAPAPRNHCAARRALAPTECLPQNQRSRSEAGYRDGGRDRRDQPRIREDAAPVGGGDRRAAQGRRGSPSGRSGLQNRHRIHRDR
jgi:sensor domain CHASE-containing protein